ncbi:hypothetical protein ABZ714_28660 [Streptomyces sp. NPDC006798]|uniref:hypothetical protein n=1 Tax=Streptomyces sp. NPDC006798 TaxID=3155462 RepID=UPI0033D39A68
MSSRERRTTPVTAADNAWITIALREGRRRADLLNPTEQQGVQRTPATPVRVIPVPADVLDTVARFQKQAPHRRNGGR